MKKAYRKKAFHPATMVDIQYADAIIVEYKGQGFRLTLRQLYYQFVSRGLIQNTVHEYKRLGTIVTDGRYAGLLDWEGIEDRTRNLVDPQHWADPQEIVEAIARSYREEKWSTQPERVEVWIEKEALSGVFERICNRLDVPFLACRGYLSASEMWGGSQRLREHEGVQQTTFILYFGDHDPSGLDMERDIRRRLAEFESTVTVEHIALTMEQVNQYKPPPDFAKKSDARYEAYRRRFGPETWELDALDPATLSALVEKHVRLHRDERLWAEAEAHEQQQRGVLTAAADQWESVVARLSAD
jgi:hypothetical protein